MAISDLMSLSTSQLLPIIAVIASFAVAAGFAAWVTKQKPGTKEMRAISVSYTHLTLPTKRIV